MSKKVLKRALIGGALGALQGAQSFFQTRAAQEAEARKEERLMAIRSQERGEDRAFQRETMEAQNTQRGAERVDDRAFAVSQGDKANAALIARDEVGNAQRMKEISAQGANQLAATNASNARPPTDGYQTVQGPDGTQSRMLDSEIRNGALPQGWRIVQPTIEAAGIRNIDNPDSYTTPTQPPQQQPTDMGAMTPEQAARAAEARAPETPRPPIFIARPGSVTEIPVAHFRFNR